MSSFKDLRIVDNFYQTSAFYPMPTVLMSTLAEDGSTCVIVETQWTDGTITRELIDLEKDDSVFAETFYTKNEHSLTKQNTEIIWK